MPNYKKPANKAKETATFRFTTIEKQMLAHLANEDGITQTDLVRKLIADYAVAKGVESIPLPDKKPRPGRPKMKKPRVKDVLPPKVDFFDTMMHHKGTFGELVMEFRGFFSLRGEKMQAELDDTIRFVIEGRELSVLFADTAPLDAIDSRYLANAREQIKNAPIRFPQKNLHMTYLRMIFNYGKKNGYLSREIDVATLLRPFTAKEVADALPLPMKRA